LIGEALSLHYARAEARSPHFAQVVDNWRAMAADASTWSPSPADTPGDQCDGFHGPNGIQPTTAAAPTTDRQTANASSHSLPLGNERADPEAGCGPDLSPPGELDAGPVPGVSENLGPDPPLWWPVAGAATVSDIASLLLLTNFVAWLDDVDLTPGPTGWNLVGVLGRYLLRERFADLSPDPVWHLLADLDAGADRTRSDTAQDRHDVVRLPESWLRKWFAVEPAYVRARSGDRLIVSHRTHGFVVADLPVTGAEEAWVAEPARLGVPRIEVGGVSEPEVTSPGERWPAVLGGFVEWLLSSRQIQLAALTSPGRVYTSATHLDVVLSLESIDMPARIAGLDQDPGWVPALGRIVLFHFVEGHP
jgi:hypothetical protein